MKFNLPKGDMPATCLVSKIVSVQMSVFVCICLCVCVSTPEDINN